MASLLPNTGDIWGLYRSLIAFCIFLSRRWHWDPDWRTFLCAYHKDCVCKQEELLHRGWFAVSKCTVLNCSKMSSNHRFARLCCVFRLVARYHLHKSKNVWLHSIVHPFLGHKTDAWATNFFALVLCLLLIRCNRRPIGISKHTLESPRWEDYSMTNFGVIAQP